VITFPTEGARPVQSPIRVLGGFVPVPGPTYSDMFMNIYPEVLK